MTKPKKKSKSKKKPGVSETKEPKIKPEEEIEETNKNPKRKKA